MAVDLIPARIRWAVDLMDIQADDKVLEIGCGPGAAAELMCSRLEPARGRLFAIDRSESGVDRTRRRNAAAIEDKRLTVRQIDLATLRIPVKRLSKVFAFNVNLFWVRQCTDEVALLHERLRPGGVVGLFYDASRPDQVPQILTGASAALEAGGFRVAAVRNERPAVVGLLGRR